MFKLINLKKFIGLRTLKTALGAGLAILFANLLNLDYGVNTAIVVILSLQNSKRKSLNLAGVRILSTIIALAISKVVFSIFGFGPFSFSVYLLFFIPMIVRFELNEGLVPSSVLVSHLLASQSVAFANLANEFLQMVIGVSIALVLNLYIPGLEEHLVKDLAAIKKIKYRILENMKISLSNESDFKEYKMMIGDMEQRIKLAYERVLAESGENLNRGLDYHFKYIKMETNHLEILSYMNKNVETLRKGYSDSILLPELIETSILQLKATKMDPEEIQRMQNYLDELTDTYLLESKDAFHVKLAVFQYIGDLIKLLNIRYDFLKSLSDDDGEIYKDMYLGIQEAQ